MARHGVDRVDRKALREPDEFIVLVRRFLTWAGTHRQRLVLIGSVAAVVALGVLLAGWNSARRNRQAAERFRDAYAAFEKGEADMAARAFAMIEQDYEATSFGRLATVYRGHALRDAGDMSGALTAYQAALEEAPPGSDLRQLVLMSLARIEEVTPGGLETALEHYRAAGGLDGPEQHDALLGTARVLRTLGRHEDARRVYQRLLEATTAERRAFVEAQLASLPRSS